MLATCQLNDTTPNSRKFVIRSISISDAMASVNSRVVAGSWQGRGRVVAGKRHGMCESVFKTAGEQQGNGMGTALERHSMCESALTVTERVSMEECNDTNLKPMHPILFFKTNV
jgi:hypothetical protein